MVKKGKGNPPAAQGSADNPQKDEAVPAKKRAAIMECVKALLAPKPANGESARCKDELRQLVCGVSRDFFDASIPKGQMDGMVNDVVVFLSMQLNAQNPPATPAGGGGGGGAVGATPATAAADAPKATADNRCVWGGGSHGDKREPNAKLMDSQKRASPRATPPRQPRTPSHAS